MRTAIVFLIFAAFALVALGYIGGTDEGERVATVTFSQSAQTWKSNAPETRMQVTLENGTEIYATSPHTPPPAPGDRIVLEVRKNIFGWHSYTWQPGKAPRQ